jgi:hypothetical protein
MSIIKTLVVMAPLALSTAAMAAPSHFTDTQFVAASRCQALMASTELGRQDTHEIDALLKAQERSRAVAVIDLAQTAREDAVRAARHAGAYGKASLIAERDGACRAFTGEGAMSTAATSSGTPRAN